MSIVCGKCKVVMRSATSTHSIRKTRQAFGKTMVCSVCFHSAADWQRRDITSQDLAVEQVRSELKRLVKGRVMLRENKSYKGDALNGIYHWDVYFDDPNDRDKIGMIIGFAGFNAGGFRIIGGAYGYVRSFRTK